MCMLPLPSFRQANAGPVARVEETWPRSPYFLKLSLLAADNVVVHNNGGKQTSSAQGV